MKDLAVNALAMLAVSFFMPQTVNADEPAPLPVVLSDCRATLARLSFIRYTIKATPIRETNHPTNQMMWREEGNKCRYDYFCWRNDGSEAFEASYSFDGERSYYTWYGKGLYFTRRGPRPFDDWIKNLGFITVPFDFAVRAEGISPWEQPNIALLKTDQVWARLAKEATMVGTRMYKSRPCTVLRINHGVYRISNIVPPVATPTYFLVYFDAKNSMPIAWKQYDEQNHLVEELEVTAEQAVSLPEGSWYIAPRQIKETFFEYQDPKCMGTELNAWTFDYTDVSTAHNPGEDFRLDSAKAHWINDEDTHWGGPPPR